MTYKCEFHSEVENVYNKAYEWYEPQKINSFFPADGALVLWVTRPVIGA
jgi:hypothetical protein